MKTSLKSVIEVLNRDANQLEHHAQKLKAISPDISLDLESDAELIDQRVASIRKQVEILERWEWCLATPSAGFCSPEPRSCDED